MGFYRKALCLLSLASTTLAQFGLTEDSDSFIINAGSANSLVTTVRKSDCDVRSIIFRGTELQGPQDQGTHIGSGLGSATVTAETLDGECLANTCDSTDAKTPQINTSRSLVIPTP